jgi:outer membrane protein OmpA-like peptidoglycan-associated protein
MLPGRRDAYFYSEISNMKRHPGILAGTALGFLMASSPSGAFPISSDASHDTYGALKLVQTDCLEGETAEACALRLQQKAPAEEQATPPEEAPAPNVEPAPPATEAPPTEQRAPQAPTAEPAPPPSDQSPAENPAPEQPAPEVPAADQPAPAPEVPATGEQPAQSGEAPADPNVLPADGNAAPVLDSQKEAPPADAGQPAQSGEQAAQPAPAPVDQGPPPESDAAATQAAQPAEIKPVTDEQGTRVDRAPGSDDLRRRERPDGVDVVREIGDRIIIEINNQVIVESNDRPRLSRGAREVYYEDLPRGRTRETIVRENGTQVITIRNRYGDIIRRSRITPDGREYVLIYVDDRYYDRVGDWRDPGLDLGPIRLTIPVNEYILLAANVDDPDAYYEFLEQPPVERVQRLYSVDEVKRSARIRDIARRVDLDTLTFEFGSADIPQSEVAKLEGIAKAMERLLEKNPAETFLIEGHTDAVGSDLDNLALSDRRAEAVADALTNAFAIPPENLATQGYGEQYLKVETEEANRQNRRVAVRRITPLVAPVASAK